MKTYILVLKNFLLTIAVGRVRSGSIKLESRSQNPDPPKILQMQNNGSVNYLAIGDRIAENFKETCKRIAKSFLPVATDQGIGTY
jgi:hypothetical protein